MQILGIPFSLAAVKLTDQYKCFVLTINNQIINFFKRLTSNKDDSVSFKYSGGRLLVGNVNKSGPVATINIEVFFII